MFQYIDYTTDENTYECFLKIRDNLSCFPEIERIYREECMQRGISPQYSEYRKDNSKRDSLLNYALTIYVDKYITACNIIDSYCTHIEYKDEFLFIFINEITQGKKILFNFIPLNKLPSTMDEDLKWEITRLNEFEHYKNHRIWIGSEQVYNYYLQNTRTAYLNFNKCRYNNKKQFKYTFKDVLMKIIEECKVHSYKMPPLNTYLRIGYKEHCFEFLVCDVVGIPRVSLSPYGLSSIEATEEIPLIVITGYHNYQENRNNIQLYKSW